MTRDNSQKPSTSDKMLQIQSMQKAQFSSIFDEPKTESKESTIHSGHFMVSRVHEDKDEDDEEESPIFSDEAKDFGANIGFDFVQANKATSQTYNFGPKSTQTLSIDASLTKLFECMTLAYSGKITSPKWKPFRGMHLTVKDKVRLNNIIWREWHMQYIYHRRSVVCQFATPLSDYIHTKPEAVVLEGKYWKRRLDTVTKEYKKWRRYYRDRIWQNCSESTPLFSSGLSEYELLERVKDVSGMPRNFQQSSTDLSLLNADLMDMDFTDNLFSSLNPPFAFPNPRELGQFTCADLIQPGLVQLQPNLEDFMDIDTMQEFLAVSRSAMPQSSVSASASTLSHSMLQDLSMDLSQSSSQQVSLAQSLLGLMDPTIFSSGGGSAAGINMLTALAALTSSNALTSTNNTTFSFGTYTPTPPPPSTVTSGSILASFTSDTPMVLDDSLGKGSFQANAQPNFFSGQSQDQAKAHKRAHQSFSTQGFHRGESMQTVNMTGLGLAQALSPVPLAPTSPSPGTHLRNAHTRKEQGQTPVKLIPRAASPSNTAMTVRSVSAPGGLSAAGQKKDGFAVPQGKPAHTPRKPRFIAPALTPPRSSPAPATTTPSMQSTYLAQLLTKGTYPGAIISVKKEPAPAPAVALPTSNFTPILPAVSTPTPAPARIAPSAATAAITPTFAAATPVRLPTDIAMEINKVAGSDFPTSVLLAAASTALGTTSSNLKDALRFSPAVTATLTTSLDLTSSQLGSPGSGSPMRMSVSPSISPAPSPGLASSFEALTGSPLELSSGLLGSPQHLLDGEKSDRRVAHLTAEQKRRCNLKSGFDLLHTLVPSLAQNPKVSKATMLQKTAEHCRKMKSERSQMQQEAGILKQEIESLNAAISVVQSQLPETGVPVTRQRVDQMKEMFQEYVKSRTLLNWKFWIFSIIIRSLFDSYNNMVSTANMEELCRTTLAWLDQHCSLVSLRPTVLNALRHLSTTTSILTEPQRVREQATQAVTKGIDAKNNKCGGNPGSA